MTQVTKSREHLPCLLTCFSSYTCFPRCFSSTDSKDLYPRLAGGSVGDYPASMREKCKERLPSFTKEESNGESMC